MNPFNKTFIKFLWQASAVGIATNIIAIVAFNILLGTLWLLMGLPITIVCWPIAAALAWIFVFSERHLSLCVYIISLVLFLLVGIYISDFFNRNDKEWYILFYLFYIVSSFPSLLLLNIFIVPRLFGHGNCTQTTPPPIPKKGMKQQEEFRQRQNSNS